MSRFRPNAVRTIAGDGEPHGGGRPLFVLLCTWNEEDVVFASVSNAFELGADRVFLIDNGSTDRTVAEATAAGAEYVMTFVTEQFDELYKYQLMNGEIRRISEAVGRREIWWWLKDADEFLAVPGRRDLPAFLSSVDARCRVVGARVLDHYPTPGQTYVRRSNPLHVQPMCREKVDRRCRLGHHKHPIFLWRAAGRQIVVEPGFHQLRCEGELTYEPRESVVIHHHPYRNEADARARLLALQDRGTTKASEKASADAHMKARLESLEAVYRGDYDDVVDYQTGRRGVTVEDWRAVIDDW